MLDIFTLDNPIQETDSSLFRLGTVSSTSGGITVTFDGESSATTKKFHYNSSVTFSIGNRVLCCLVGGTWFVLCKVS